MTELQWNACTDSVAMLAALRGHNLRLANGDRLRRGPSERKQRLFICACLRAMHLDLSAWTRECIPFLEKYADGVASQWEIDNYNCERFLPPEDPDHAIGIADSIGQQRQRANILREIIGNPCRPVAIESRYLTADVLSIAQAAYNERDWGRLTVLADALEEAGCSPEEKCWRCKGSGRMIVKKAKEQPPGVMVSFRAEFDVDDWLCEDCWGKRVVPNSLLEHLRGDANHVRGCWALDCILGKE